MSTRISWLAAGLTSVAAGVGLVLASAVEGGIAFVVLGAGLLAAGGFVPPATRPASADASPDATSQYATSQVPSSPDDLTRRIAELRKLEDRLLAGGVSPSERAYHELRLGREAGEGPRAPARPDDLDPDRLNPDKLNDDERRLAEMAARRCDRVWEGIRERRYVRSEDGRVTDLDGGAIFAEVREIVQEVAGLYHAQSDNAVLEVRTGDVALAVRSAVGDLLHLVNQVPYVDPAGWTVRSVVERLEQAQKGLDLYRKVSPYQPYVNAASVAARLALGANPITLAAWTVGSQVAWRAGEKVVRSYAETWLKELLETSVALVYVHVARTYDPRRAYRGAGVDRARRGPPHPRAHPRDRPQPQAPPRPHPGRADPGRVRQDDAAPRAGRRPRAGSPLGAGDRPRRRSGRTSARRSPSACPTCSPPCRGSMRRRPARRSTIWSVGWTSAWASIDLTLAAPPRRPFRSGSRASARSSDSSGGAPRKATAPPELLRSVYTGGGALARGGDRTMSRQSDVKQAHELGCLKAAQESLAGFPQGEIKPGDDPPDCYVVAPGSDPVAFELTEQVDSIAARAGDLAERFIGKAKDELFRRHPELRTGWMISASPGDVFEAAAQPQHQRGWKERRGELIDRFVSAVTGEIAARYSFPWRVSGEPIWTFNICRKIQPQILTEVMFQGSFGYSYKSKDRVENDFGRDVTLRPKEIQNKIAEKARGLKRYHCRPAYLLMSASLFPRSVRNAKSFAVLKTPESVVDHPFCIGAFTAVFLHDPDARSYRIGQDGRAVEMRRRRLRDARPRWPHFRFDLRELR